MHLLIFGLRRRSIPCRWVLGLFLCVVCAAASYVTCTYVLEHGKEIMNNPSAEFADFAAEHLGRLGWYLHPIASYDRSQRMVTYTTTPLDVRYATFIASVVVLLGAAAAMHGYMATSLQELLQELVGWDSRDGGTALSLIHI